MATKNISTYPVVDTIKDADKVVLSKDGTVRLVEIGTVKADMRKEIRDAKGEIQNELNSKTSATEAALDAERTARANTDTALGKRVDDEAEARTNADADLQESIEAEETARENADTNLQTQIDNRYTKAETDDLVDAKQDQLSESQLAATNSGLTSNDKTKLDDLSYTITSDNISINTDNIPNNNDNSPISGSGSIRFARVGRLVELTFTGEYDAAAYGIYNNVYTIPTEFRPQRTSKHFVVTSRIQAKPIGIDLKTTGEVDIYVMSGFDRVWNLTGCNTIMYFI